MGQSQGHRKKTRKGLITRNTRLKYQSSRTHCSKVFSNVSFQKMGQLQGNRVKNNNTHGKGIFMWNIKALTLTEQGVSFQKMGQTPGSRGQKNCYPWKGFITGNIYVKYQALALTVKNKIISKVTVSESIWQNDRQDKSNMA